VYAEAQPDATLTLHVSLVSPDEDARWYQTYSVAGPQDIASIAGDILRHAPDVVMGWL
jgi:hypothetical protein